MWLRTVCCWSATRVEMWVTRDENEHLIFALSAKLRLPFARVASSAGRVMRSTTLLLLAAAAAAHYQHYSIPELCHSQNKIVQVKEAVILSIWSPEEETPASPDCELHLQAPPGHLLSIAYITFNNQTGKCPIKLDLVHRREQFNATLEDLCARQLAQNSTLPNMYMGDMSLMVHGSSWPPPGHSLMATAIGLNHTCMDRKRYFPCVMMDTPRNAITSHLKFCVPTSVVCDDLLNCPASGADEIQLLCKKHNESADQVTQQLRRLSEKTHLELLNNMTQGSFENQESVRWWWFAGAAGILVVLILTGVSVATFFKGWNKTETESQLGLSLSACTEQRPPHEEPPPDYKSIFPAEEEV